LSILSAKNSAVVNFINLSRNNEPTLSFQELFKPRNFNWRGVFCNHGNYEEQYTYTMNHNHYLLIRITSCEIRYNNNREIYEEYPTLITDFNP